MQIKIFKSLWGMEDVPDFEEKLRRIRDAGYDGFEHNIDNGTPENLTELLARYGLEWCAQVIRDDADDLAREIERVAPLRPLCVVAHGGRDHYDFERGCRFFERALAAEKEFGLPVAHETHRYRLLYSPYAARDYLRRLPELRINADFSHWTVVCECLLDDISDIMDLACSRAIHVHARVGHEEGPQVSDPRAPEFDRHCARFETWWTRIRDERARARAPWLIVVPEYGPPGYMQTLPHTRRPVADLWEVCLWQADRLRALWGLPERFPPVSNI